MGWWQTRESLDQREARVPSQSLQVRINNNTTLLILRLQLHMPRIKPERARHPQTNDSCPLIALPLNRIHRYLHSVRLSRLNGRDAISRLHAQSWRSDVLWVVEGWGGKLFPYHVSVRSHQAAASKSYWIPPFQTHQSKPTEDANRADANCNG